MASAPKDKIKQATPVAPKPVPHDPARLFMSYDDVVKKNKLRKEIEAKLEIERLRLEAEYEKENSALEALGKEELESSMKKSGRKGTSKSVEEE